MGRRNLVKRILILSLAMLFTGLHLINVHAKEIVVKVGVAMDQTGPLSPAGRKGVSSWLWYQDYINSEKGGWKDINGNKVILEVIYGDTGFNPAKTVSLYKKFKSEGMVAFGNIGSVEVAAVRNMCLDDKIPSPTNSGSLIYPLPSPCFGHWPDYSACSAAIIDYVKQKWEKSRTPWTKKRPPQLVFIGPEAYPSWEASITPEVMRYAKLQGVKVVGKFFIPINPIDTKSQILAAKAAGADFIYTGVVVSQGGAVIRDLYDLGLKGDPTKQEGKIEGMIMFPITELEMISIAGGREEVGNDVIIVGSQEYAWADKPTLRLIRKYAEKNREIGAFDHNYVHEWYAGMRTDKAIELALQKVSGDKLTGKDVWEGFLRIKDFDTGGILPNKITFSEEDRLGIEKVRIDRFEGKKRTLVDVTNYKMLAPVYTEEYAKSHGKKSIYSDESLRLLKLTVEEVGFKRIKE